MHAVLGENIFCKNIQKTQSDQKKYGQKTIFTMLKSLMANSSGHTT